MTEGTLKGILWHQGESDTGSENKKFLETDYPQGRAIGVFRRFHFDLRSKKELRKAVPTSPKER